MKRYVFTMLAVTLLASCARGLPVSQDPQTQPVPLKKTVMIPADWKTYTDAGWGLALRYPPHWNITHLKTVEHSHDVLSFAPADAEKPLYAFQIAEMDIRFDAATQPEIVEKKTIRLNNTTGTRIRYYSNNTGFQTTTEINQDGRTLLFVVPDPTGRWSEDVYETADTVMASLKPAQ